MARRLGLSNISSYLFSFVYFGSSYFGGHFALGHMPFTHFCYLPWFLYFLLKADDNWKYIFGSAISLVLIIFGNGAAVPFLYTLFFSLVFVILYGFLNDKWHLIKKFILASLFGILLASVKFIPMMNYLIENRWKGLPEDFTPPSILFLEFFSFNQNIFRPTEQVLRWDWHEYSAYIFPLVALLGLYFAIKEFKKARIWIFIAGFFLIFGLGNFSDFSLWNLFMQIPGFSSIRCPARAFQFVILSVGILAGFGMDNLASQIKLPDKAKKYIMLIFVLIVLMTNFLINLPNFRTIAYKQPEKAVYNEDFKHVIGRKDNIYNQFLHNQGSLVSPWLSGYKDSRAIVTPQNDVLMEYIPEGKLEVIQRKYTPNYVEYDIAPSESGTIIFGIGFDEGWHAVDNRLLIENNGLVSVQFGINDRKIALSYCSPYFILGLFISLITMGCCILLFSNRKFAHRFESILK